MIGYIYKVTNKINNKVYIGQTVLSVKRRWNQHKRNAKYSEIDEHYNQHFARAILKYGPDNFLVEVLETIEGQRNEVKEKLNSLEIFYIAKFDSMNLGYNSTKGGESCLGRINELSSNSKPIIQYDYDGNIIAEYPCLAEAARLLNVHEDVIRKCANGYKPFCRKLECIWRWKGDLDKPTIATDIPRIIQYSLDGVIVKKWYSYTTIINEKGEGYAKNVSRACLGRRKTFNGFMWKYEIRK